MSIASDIKRMRAQIKREVAKAQRCRWGGCGAPGVFEFRRRLKDPHRSDSEFYCNKCADLARQSYCCDQNGRWPSPPIAAEVCNLPLSPLYGWIERIEVVRIKPYPVGSEQAAAVECALLTLARKD